MNTLSPLETIRSLLRNGTGLQKKQLIGLTFEHPAQLNKALKDIIHHKKISPVIKAHKKPLTPKASEYYAFLMGIVEGYKPVERFDELNIPPKTLERISQEISTDFDYKPSGPAMPGTAIYKTFLTKLRAEGTPKQKEHFNLIIKKYLPPKPTLFERIKSLFHKIKDLFVKKVPWQREPQTIFTYALENPAEDIVGILIKEHGFKLNTEHLWQIGSNIDKTWWKDATYTPSQEALENTKRLFLRALESGADIHSTIGNPVYFKNTIFHTLLSNMQFERADALIEAITEYNAVRPKEQRLHLETPDRFGKTALHMAILTGATDIAKKLIAAGAGVHSCDEDGVTPLHQACCLGNIALAETLIAHGASIEAKDKNGRTPEEYMGQAGQVRDMLKSIDIDPDKHYQARWSFPLRFIAPEDTITTHALRNQAKILDILHGQDHTPNIHIELGTLPNPLLATTFEEKEIKRREHPQHTTGITLH